MKLKKERQLIVEYGKKLIDADLTTGTGGNLSIINRNKSLIAVTPSAIDYYQMKKDDIVVTDLEGNIVEAKNKATTELPLHLAVYKNRSDIAAVVHTHSIFATSVACLNIDLPPIHYLIAAAGDKVPCADYAAFGTEKLAQAAVKSLGDQYQAVLLSNHGLLSCGADIKEAFNTAESIEYVAELYCRTEAVGKAAVLSPAEIKKVKSAFENYGQ